SLRPFRRSFRRRVRLAWVHLALQYGFWSITPLFTLQDSLHRFSSLVHSLLRRTDLPDLLQGVGDLLHLLPGERHGAVDLMAQLQQERLKTRGGGGIAVDGADGVPGGGEGVLQALPLFGGEVLRQPLLHVTADAVHGQGEDLVVVPAEVVEAPDEA